MQCQDETIALALNDIGQQVILQLTRVHRHESVNDSAIGWRDHEMAEGVVAP